MSVEERLARVEVRMDDVAVKVDRLLRVVADGNGRPSLVSRVDGIEREFRDIDEIHGRLDDIERTCQRHLPRVEEGSLPPRKSRRGDSMVVEKWKVVGMLIALVLAPLAAALATYLTR